MPESLSSDHSRSEPRPTEARLLDMVFPDNTNHLGTLFGGQALAWMDMSAFIAASRYARTTVVTARSEQVDFNLPIHKGDLVEVVARVVKVGRSSMNVDVEVITENLLTGERKLCTRGHFVMSALDPLGRGTEEGNRNVVVAVLGDECANAQIMEEGRILRRGGRVDAALRVICPAAIAR